MSLGSVAKVSIAVIVAVAVAAIASGTVLPVGINALVDDVVTTETQDTGESVQLEATLNATLDSTDTSGSPDNATYTLTDSTGNSVTNTVDNGSTTTFSLNDGDVDVSPQDVNSGSATTQYSYAKDFGWSGGAKSLWGIIDLVVVLAVLLLMLGIAMKAVDAV